MTSPIQSALIRSLIGGIFSAAAMFATTWAVFDGGPGAKEVILPTLMSFLLYAGPRLGLEGIYDQKKST